MAKRTFASIIFAGGIDSMDIQQLSERLRIPVEDLARQWRFMADRSDRVTRESFARYCRLRRMPADEQHGRCRVYFVHAPKARLIKIGYSSNLESRIADLNNGSPVPLVLLTSISGGRATEAELHRRFADLRTRGEWFRATKTLRDFVESFAVEPDEEIID